MKNRDLGLEILQGIKEIKDFNKEKKTLKTREFKKVPPVHIIRKKLNLSQFNFANLIGISVRTIQDWEQGKRNPTGSQNPYSELLNKNQKYLHKHTKKALAISNHL